MWVWPAEMGVSPRQMNKFFKPALSLLLELRLGDCSIDKRLRPLVTFLGRHRTALKRYIYPECFSKIILLLWKHILQVCVCAWVWVCTCRACVRVCVRACVCERWVCPAGPGGGGSEAAVCQEGSHWQSAHAPADSLREDSDLLPPFLPPSLFTSLSPLSLFSQHLIKFMHDRGNGIPLDHLSASSVSPSHFLCLPCLCMCAAACLRSTSRACSTS